MAWMVHLTPNEPLWGDNDSWGVLPLVTITDPRRNERPKRQSALDFPFLEEDELTLDLIFFTFSCLM